MSSQDYRSFPSMSDALLASQTEAQSIYAEIEEEYYLIYPDGTVRQDVSEPVVNVPADSKPSLSDHFNTEEFHNFQGDTEAIWKLRAIATGPNCLSGVDRMKEAIRPKWYYMHKVNVSDAATKALKQCWRTVLIDPAFIAYAFVSDGVAADVARLADTYPGEWDDKLPAFMVEEQKTGSGNSILKLVPQFK